MSSRLSHQTPTAKRSHLVTTELANEVVIYDTTSHQLHTLNPTATFVWQHCDGQTTVAEIARQFAQNFEVEHAEDLVWSALDQLADKGLLVEDTTRPDWVVGITRREMMTRAAITAIALVPLVRSLVAPTPAAAQSAPNGSSSTTPNDVPTIGRFWYPPQDTSKTS